MVTCPSPGGVGAPDPPESLDPSGGLAGRADSGLRVVRSVDGGGIAAGIGCVAGGAAGLVAGEDVGVVGAAVDALRGSGARCPGRWGITPA